MVRKDVHTNTAARLPMNRFQAMAKIMAMLTEDGELKKGSREYKLARKLVTSMIERLGPDEAFASISLKKADFLHHVGVLGSFDDFGRPIPETKF
jgi:hypothetical protein